MLYTVTMTDKDKIKLKEKIVKDIEEIKVNITELIELTKPIAPENAIGRVSRMDAINNKSVNDAALRQARLRLDKMEIAIKKIDSAEYGLCKSCKEIIPLPRLMYMPESSHCVKCAR